MTTTRTYTTSSATRYTKILAPASALPSYPCLTNTQPLPGLGTRKRTRSKKPGQQTAGAGGRRRSVKEPLDRKDLECALCLRVFCNPITTPCKHTFCLLCLSDSLHYNKKCPLCRHDIADCVSKCTTDHVNKDIQRKIQQHIATHEVQVRVDEEKQEEHHRYRKATFLATGVLASKGKWASSNAPPPHASSGAGIGKGVSQGNYYQTMMETGIELPSINLEFPSISTNKSRHAVSDSDSDDQYDSYTNANGVLDRSALKRISEMSIRSHSESEGTGVGRKKKKKKKKPARMLGTRW
eukprot:TRINITY_DN66304_c4_g9_i1.p1 TRINITY_DN66304_c4_g9~~TRINITY_DN66304_c4_g9_i1.p1  ORF type:complete len:296 (-),score=19.85 TRINITY_DN66304_c4_g9_i1:67-954(-)